MLFLTPVGLAAAGGIALLCKHAQPARNGPGIAICRKSRPPQQQFLGQTTHTQTTLSQPATHLRGPTRLARLFATVAICSVARLKARAIPTAQGLGLIPQLLWVARFSPDRHFTPRTARLTPSRSRTAPRTSPREHTWRLVHNPRLRQSAASISCRSQSDAHSEPPDAESYGPCLLAHGRGSVDVLCLSAHSPTPQALPRTHPMACPNPDPASLWHTGVLEAMLQPREMGTPGSGQPQRCGVHPHRASPR